MNGGFAAPAIAGMHADGFAEEFFDSGDEGLREGEVEVGEGDLGGFETAGERACDVGLWGGLFLDGKLASPKCVCDLGL